VILLAHPNVPTCDDCKHWMYDSKTWQRNKRGTRFVRRPQHVKPPCRACPKCQDEKTPSPAVGQRNTLNRRNQETLQRFHEHQAAGGPVDDPITRKNFGIIQQMFDVYQRSQARAIIEVMASR